MADKSSFNVPPIKSFSLDNPTENQLENTEIMNVIDDTQDKLKLRNLKIANLSKGFVL